jgi:primosomal protein N' (replication factor Y)
MPIARIALPVAAETTFDYWAPEGLGIVRGSVVRVRLGPRKLTGLVIHVVDSTDVAREKLQTIDAVVPNVQISEDVLDMATFVAGYYQEPVGMSAALAVPPLVTRRRAGRAPKVDGDAAVAVVGDELVELNAEQRGAIGAIAETRGRFSPSMLFGVTGSGKTDVYLAAAASMIEAGGQVLLLVPEINLTPQLEHRVRRALPGVAVAVLHSGLASGERFAHWQSAAAGEARLVVGTRLAVFVPMPELSLVIVDEEHDSSYKQQENVRYHARDVAVWRAHRRKVPVVLGSATPSLETWLHACEGRYQRLDLPRRADPRARMPRLRFADNRPARALEGIGEALREALAVRLARGEQSLVFVNRRGFSPSLLCSACGWEADCPRCSARLTVHRVPAALRCHHCGHEASVPTACPTCGNVDLLPLGYGTQRLERVLADAFPAARISRIDRDSTRTKGAFAAMRNAMTANELDILIGTQMLAKGHDFPRLTLVGVLGADNALYSADFRATERLAALLMQVSGRAGRAGLAGEVIIQTDFPDHPVYAAIQAHDYARLADGLLEERKVAELPPFTHVAVLAAEAHHRSDVDEFLRAAHAAGLALTGGKGAAVEVFSPVTALLARRAGFERGQVVVQSARRAALQQFLPVWRAALAARPGRRVRWSIDVDPAGFA